MPVKVRTGQIKSDRIVFVKIPEVKCAPVYVSHSLVNWRWTKVGTIQIAVSTRVPFVNRWLSFWKVIEETMRFIQIKDPFGQRRINCVRVQRNPLQNQSVTPLQLSYNCHDGFMSQKTRETCRSQSSSYTTRWWTHSSKCDEEWIFISLLFTKHLFTIALPQFRSFLSWEPPCFLY